MAFLTLHKSKNNNRKPRTRMETSTMTQSSTSARRAGGPLSSSARSAGSSLHHNQAAHKIGHHSRRRDFRYTAIRASRILVLVVLGLVTSVLSYLAYSQAASHEQTLAELILQHNDDFHQKNQTINPTWACVTVLLSMLVVILAFLLYDYLVRQEFRAKKELLDARRQFMRFVSHEVRTPLNAVSMGLDLMQSELAQALGFETVTAFRASQDYENHENRSYRDLFMDSSSDDDSDVEEQGLIAALEKWQTSNGLLGSSFSSIRSVPKDDTDRTSKQGSQSLLTPPSLLDGPLDNSHNCNDEEAPKQSAPAAPLFSINPQEEKPNQSQSQLPPLFSINPQEETPNQSQSQLPPLFSIKPTEETTSQKRSPPAAPLFSLQPQEETDQAQNNPPPLFAIKTQEDQPTLSTSRPPSNSSMSRLTANNSFNDTERSRQRPRQSFRRSVSSQDHSISSSGVAFRRRLSIESVGRRKRRPSGTKALSAIISSRIDSCVIEPQKARDWFQLCQEIQGNAAGAVDILSDLLNYDKIEQRNLTLGLEVLCIWDILETAMNEFKLPASSKKVRLGINYFVSDESAHESADFALQRAKDLPGAILDLKVIGDSVRLTQVLRNLMSNALKFTSAGGKVQVEARYVPPPETKNTNMNFSIQSHFSQVSMLDTDFTLQNGDIVTCEKEGYIEILVTDSGAGMSKEQLSKLFQDGVQFNANELQKGGGSGLGLFIAKGIAEQHKGNLCATSDGIGLGTTFELRLPLWRVEEDDDDMELPSSALKDGTGTGADTMGADSMSDTIASRKDPISSLKILVVDDIKSNRKLLRRLLENNGHECDEAENGQVAVAMTEKAASTRAYDCILLDFEMPVMDGPTAAKHIRELGLDVNMVGVTGNVLPEDVSYFMASGANDVLAKPVKMPDLYASWIENGVRSQQQRSSTKNEEEPPLDSLDGSQK